MVLVRKFIKLLHQQFNYNHSPGPTIYYNSYFGSGYGPVAYSYVYCNGWEQDIHDCTKTVYPGFTCPSTYVAGAVCKEGLLK